MRVNGEPSASDSSESLNARRFEIPILSLRDESDEEDHVPLERRIRSANLEVGASSQFQLGTRPKNQPRTSQLGVVDELVGDVEVEEDLVLKVIGFQSLQKSRIRIQEGGSPTWSAQDFITKLITI